MSNPVQLPSGISTFGVGRLLYTPAGALGPIQVGLLNDVEVNIKKDLKAVWSEGSFPALVGDGHASIEITAKGYQFRLLDIQNDYGAGIATVGASTYAERIDEAGTIPASSGGGCNYTLGASGMIAGTLVVNVFQAATATAQSYAVNYSIVASGSEVAGTSCSVTAGVVRFAPGDAGLSATFNYQYANTAGQAITIGNYFQNSQTPYILDLVKRDRNPVDGSTIELLVRFFAVRSSGIKVPFKDNDWSDVDRSYMAYANSLGLVYAATIVSV